MANLEETATENQATEIKVGKEKIWTLAYARYSVNSK